MKFKSFFLPYKIIRIFYLLNLQRSLFDIYYNAEKIN